MRFLIRWHNNTLCDVLKLFIGWAKDESVTLEEKRKVIYVTVMIGQRKENHNARG